DVERRTGRNRSAYRLQRDLGGLRFQRLFQCGNDIADNPRIIAGTAPRRIVEPLQDRAGNTAKELIRTNSNRQNLWLASLAMLVGGGLQFVFQHFASSGRIGKQRDDRIGGADPPLDGLCPFDADLEMPVDEHVVPDGSESFLQGPQQLLVRLSL